jgi:hypothetical protein
MTPEEARQLIGVDGAFSLEELTEAFHRRSRDTELKIELAPTAGLKEKLRHDLGQLEEAWELLSDRAVAPQSPPAPVEPEAPSHAGPKFASTGRRVIKEASPVGKTVPTVATGVLKPQGGTATAGPTRFVSPLNPEPPASSNTGAKIFVVVLVLVAAVVAFLVLTGQKTTPVFTPISSDLAQAPSPSAPSPTPAPEAPADTNSNLSPAVTPASTPSTAPDNTAPASAAPAPDTNSAATDTNAATPAAPTPDTNAPASAPTPAPSAAASGMTPPEDDFWKGLVQEDGYNTLSSNLTKQRKQQLLAFIQQWRDHNAAQTPDGWVSDFAVQTTYGDDGTVDHNYLIIDRNKLISKWPTRQYQFAPAQIISATNDNVEMMLAYDWNYTSVDGVQRAGTSYNRLELIWNDPSWLITSFKETDQK